MFNVMLDDLPTKYKDFPICTDFDIGIQIMKALEDEELTQQERIGTALSLLFITEEGNPLSIPNINTAMDGLKWFLTDWYHDNKDKDDKTKVTDWDIDQWRIYSAFKRYYGVNLQTDNLHFWEFMGLLTTLPPDCAYRQVIDIRCKKITSNMSAEEKNALKEAKKIYALDAVEEDLTDDEKEAVEAFMKLVGKNK